MKDLLFENEGNLTGIAESTGQHQKDILTFHKGWLKFEPHIGVAIDDYVDDDGNVETLKSEIMQNFQLDGMQFSAIEVTTNGEITIDAEYNS